MTAASRTIDTGRFVAGRDFYAALATLILIFANLCKQIPSVAATRRTVNHIGAFCCINNFSAFPAVIYIFSNDTKIDPIMTALGRAIQSIGAFRLYDRNITFSAQINTRDVCAKGGHTEYKVHKKNKCFHIHFLLDSTLHITLNIKSRMMINEKMLREDKNTFLRNSIISFSQSLHHPKSKKPISAVAIIAILPRSKNSFFLLFSAFRRFCIL